MQNTKNSPRALLERAFDLHHKGSFKEARAIYLEVLRENSYDFDATFLLGLLEGQLGNMAQSAKSLSRAAVLVPSNHLTHWHLGEVFIQLQFYTAALASFRRARKIEPNFVQALIREGDLLKDAGHYPEALTAYQAAIDIYPLSATVLYSIGNMMKWSMRLEDACQYFRRSILVAPELPQAYTNLGNTLKDLNQLDSALTIHEYASSFQSDTPTARFNQSLVLLLQGDYRRGWEFFENRWDVLLKEERRHFRKPLWTGKEDVAGRTIFVYPEQGLGDTLQFCRYLPVLSSKGVRLVFEAPLELREILQSLKGAITFINPGYPVPEFDFHVPLLSIPRALGTTMETIPAQMPYLQGSSEKNALWRSKVPSTGARRVGLAWSGGNVFRNDRNRSLALKALAPIIDLPFDFHVVQKEVRATDLEELACRPNLTFHGQQLMDFSDTAALIEVMDLIVTVDTSVAHLAGALNKPVWIMLPFAPDFRWLLDRSDSPWYPSARLFRQNDTMSWNNVIEEVRQAMIEHVG